MRSYCLSLLLSFCVQWCCTSSAELSGPSHPWQLAESRNQHVSYRNPVNHEDFFKRAKRKLILQQQKASLTPEQLATIESAEKMNRWAKMIAEMTSNKNAAAAAAAAAAPVGHQTPSVDEHKGSPGAPAFGGPRTITNTFVPQREITEEELLASGQSGGLPFSRKEIVRDYGEKRKTYRLPVPDSERQYRRPVNESILKAYHAIISNEAAPTRNPLMATSSSSFRTLTDMIRTLMDSPKKASGAGKPDRKITRPIIPIQPDVYDPVQRRRRLYSDPYDQE